MERLDRDRTLRQAGRGRDGQPSAIQLGRQRLERVLAGGVGGERPGDQVGSLRVEDGDVGLAAASVNGGVAVTEGRATDTATVPSLLTHTLLDLIRQVERVELSDRAHDAVQQHAARRLVDVLAGGDEPDAQIVEALVEGDIVSPVAGQPVQLVDDDVVDGLAVSARVLQVAQHRLEGGPPGRGARDAALDELFGDDRADGLGLALVGGPLGGDGEALLPPAALSLLAGRHPQVGHGALGRQGLAHRGEGVGSTERVHRWRNNGATPERRATARAETTIQLGDAVRFCSCCVSTHDDILSYPIRLIRVVSESIDAQRGGRVK